MGCNFVAGAVVQRRAFVAGRIGGLPRRAQIGGERKMSVGYGHYHSLPVDGFHSLVFAPSQHALWVGLRAEEEFTFRSAHLPSWVSDDCFEQSVEEVLEAGRSKASGSIFLGVDANCKKDDSNDQWEVLVRELCAVQNLRPLSQRFWTLAWQSPTGSMWKKKVDFCFSNQSSAKVESAEKLHSRNDHKPLRLSRPHVQGVMLEFERKKKSLAGWSPQTSSQHHELHRVLSKHVSLGASVE